MGGKWWLLSRRPRGGFVGTRWPSERRLSTAAQVVVEDPVQALVAQQVARLWQPMRQQRSWNEGSSRPAAPVASASGCVLRRMDGTELLDMTAGLWCVNAGYGREELCAVAYEAMLELPYHNPTMASAPQIELAAAICEAIGGDVESGGVIHFTVSGSEANEVAFKVARQYHALRGQPWRHKIVSRHRAYHGNTMGALAATGQADRSTGYGGPPPGFVKVPPPYPYRHPATAEDLARHLEDTIVYEGPETVAAFVCEPVVSGGGVLVPPDAYLAAVREVCDKFGILLVLDEVVSGFGRTGALFGHHHYKVSPDLVTMAKGLTSGYFPLGAVAVAGPVFQAFDGTLIGNDGTIRIPDRLAHLRTISTFAGHPVACAVALRNIDIVKRERLVDAARTCGAYLAAAVQEHLADHPLVGDIRHKGLLLGIELVSDKTTKAPLPDAKCAAVVDRAQDRGVLVGRNVSTVPGLANVIILAPPFVVSTAQIDSAVAVLRAVLDAAHDF